MNLYLTNNSGLICCKIICSRFFFKVWYNMNRRTDLRNNQKWLSGNSGRMNIKRKRYGFEVLSVLKFSSRAPRKFATNFATNFIQDYKNRFRKISVLGVKKDPSARVLPVARVGVEPTRCHHRRILSPLRLPIPPSRHFLILFYPSVEKCQVFSFY